jgi:stage V sporulation protein B
MVSDLGYDNFKHLVARVRQRDFSGNAGQAIKNSSYQLASNIVLKIGSLLFTIILAHLLLPDLFGLYSLALSTILLFSAFTDFGIGIALLVFVSKALAKNDTKKANSYFNLLLRWKFTLVFIISLVLLLSSYFLSTIVYNKPIFYALIVGILYIPSVALVGFLELFFKALNNFRVTFYKDIIFQVSRLILLPLTIFYLLYMNLEPQYLIAIVILVISFCYIITNIFLIFYCRLHAPFLTLEKGKLSESEVSDLKKFISPLFLTGLSLIFFAHVDTMMLGYYLPSRFLAFYVSAFSIIGSLMAIIGFTSTSLMPLFSSLKGKSLHRIFVFSRNLTIALSFLAAAVTYIFSYYIILFTYGSEYLTSVTLLRYFSLLLLIVPLSALYESYLISQRKTVYLPIVFILSTVLNIILNYFFITYGLSISEFHALLGACFATIISRFAYLLFFIVLKYKS